MTSQNELHAIRRARELASSGVYLEVADLQSQMRSEGFTLTEQAIVAVPAFTDRLMRLIREARGQISARSVLKRER